MGHEFMYTTLCLSEEGVDFFLVTLMLQLQSLSSTNEVFSESDRPHSEIKSLPLQTPPLSRYQHYR
jgi:hypothetical protein